MVSDTGDSHVAHVQRPQQLTAPAAACAVGAVAAALAVGLHWLLAALAAVVVITVLRGAAPRYRWRVELAGGLLTEIRRDVAVTVIEVDRIDGVELQAIPHAFPLVVIRGQGRQIRALHHRPGDDAATLLHAVGHRLQRTGRTSVVHGEQARRALGL